MACHQWLLLCGCIPARNKSQIAVRRSLRNGFTRALIGVLSALSFFYFFLLICIQLHQYREFDARVKLVKVSIEFADVIGEERDLSSIFVTSGGTLEANEMREARLRVDEKMKELRDIVAKTIVSFDVLNQAILYADGIPVERSKVDNLSVSFTQSLDWYNVLNRIIFDFVLEESFSEYADTSRALYGVIREALFTEYESEERGILGVVFTRGYFEDIDEYLSLTDKLSQKDSTRHELEIVLKGEFRDRFNEVLASPDVLEAITITDEWRRLAVFRKDQFSATNAFPVNSEYWYGNMTIITRSLIPFREQLFQEEQRIQRKHLVTNIRDFIIAFIALMLEITACVTLIYIAWPILKLFWQLEGQAKRASSSTAKSRTATDDEYDDKGRAKNDDVVANHNSFILNMGESESSNEDDSSMEDSIDTEPSSIAASEMEKKTNRSSLSAIAEGKPMLASTRELEAMEAPKPKKSARRKKKRNKNNITEV